MKSAAIAHYRSLIDIHEKNRNPLITVRVADLRELLDGYRKESRVKLTKAEAQEAR